jgi:hypothetical protein
VEGTTGATLARYIAKLYLNLTDRSPNSNQAVANYKPIQQFVRTFSQALSL